MSAIRSAAALAAVVLSSHALAAVVSLNPSMQGYTVTGDVMDARYRLSNTNWDHMISTSSNVSGSTLASQADIGNNAALNNVTWNFNLSFSPAGGWTYSLTNGSTVRTRTWSSDFNGVSPFRSFNAIEMFVVATNPNANQYVSVSSSATQIQFSSASATTTGSLIDLVSVSSGLKAQFLISDTDLSTFAWSLTGKVNLSYVLQPGQNAGNLDERAKFDIKGATVVPAPGAMAMMGLAGLVAGRRRWA
jgi:hypothetical protein